MPDSIEPQMVHSVDLIDRMGIPPVEQHLPDAKYSEDSPETGCIRRVTALNEWLKPTRGAIAHINGNSDLTPEGKAKELARVFRERTEALRLLREEAFGYHVTEATKASERFAKAHLSGETPARAAHDIGPEFLVSQLTAMDQHQRRDELMRAAQSDDLNDAFMVRIVLGLPTFLRNRVLSDELVAQVRSAFAEKRDPGCTQWAERTRATAQYIVDSFEGALRYLHARTGVPIPRKQ